MDEQTARDRLRALNGAWLTDEVADRLAPQVAELLAGLAAVERRLAPEQEPATMPRVGDGARDT